MSADNAPAPFAFGDAPHPQTWPEDTDEPQETGAATHTGTDPHGRAIGPAEDHTVPKLDADGDTAVEKPKRRRKGAAS